MNHKSLLLVSLSLALAFGGCSRSIKKTDGTDGATFGDGSESLPNTALADRDSKINPENADYSTLSAYVVYFDFDSFAVKASERPKLEKIAAWLGENAGAKVVLAGHTDSRGTVQYNLALGERRAIATRDYLLGLGVDASRLTTISYGEERPAQQGDNETAWQANRRCATGVIR